ncbi:MAG: sugar-binding domain-containing protein [Verrucomicrobiota bacterium]
MNPTRRAVLAFASLPLLMSAADSLDLAGTWQVALDRTDAGETERWFARPLPQTIQLPGSLPTARLGDPVTVDTRWTGSIFDKSWFTAPEYAPYREPGNIKVPFWLQPETHYTGAAWYQRTIEIPAAWTGRRVVLTLERPHWVTTVWLDERRRYDPGT